MTHGFMTDPAHVSGSTRRTDAALGAVETSGRNGASRTGCARTMDANGDTPATGQSADGSIDWEPIGRELLVDHLQESGMELKARYGEVVGTIRCGEDPSVEELEEMREALRRAEWVYEMTNKLVRGEPTGER